MYKHVRTVHSKAGSTRQGKLDDAPAAELCRFSAQPANGTFSRYDALDM